MESHLDSRLTAGNGSVCYPAQYGALSDIGLRRLNLWNSPHAASGDLPGRAMTEKVRTAWRYLKTDLKGIRKVQRITKLVDGQTPCHESLKTVSIGKMAHHIIVIRPVWHGLAMIGLGIDAPSISVQFGIDTDSQRHGTPSIQTRNGCGSASIRDRNEDIRAADVDYVLRCSKSRRSSVECDELRNPDVDCHEPRNRRVD